jgi:hypothetical protein
MMSRILNKLIDVAITEYPVKIRDLKDDVLIYS